MAGDFDYETHGSGYSTQRRADPRVESQLHAHLGDATSVLNVGAGAGSYEPHDRYVVAVEPSASMRSQRPPHRPAINGIAESLPFDDDAFDLAMATITVHQWNDALKGLAEMRRVSRGKVLVLTFDSDVLLDFWLNHYSPEVIAAERRRYPDVAAIAAAIGSSYDVVPITVPQDCTDGFGEAFYGRPERFLDPEVRKAQSGWGFVSATDEQRFVEHLTRDLASGAWDERWGYLRTLPEYDASLRLVVGHP